MQTNPNDLIFQPQPGPQEQFMATEADIAFFGGAAGGGKTYDLLLIGASAALNAPNVNVMAFRRKSTDLFNVGSMWPESEKILPYLGMTGSKHPIPKWTHRNGSVIQMKGLLHRDDVIRLKGAQIDVALFDEITEFLEEQFWYVISRMRSSSGNVKPFVRGASNPEPNWVCDMIRWWLTDDGYADPSKSGVIRWFNRIDGHLHWYDSKEEAIQGLHELGMAGKIEPMSFTFIMSKLDDNQILMRNDPSYYSKLCALDEIERKRLLEGNWFIKPTGRVFAADDFNRYAIAPANTDVTILVVDTAQKTKNANDYTVVQTWCRSANKAYLLDQARGKFDFVTQEEIIYNQYLLKKPNWVIIEDTANGPALIQNLRRRGVPIVALTRNKDKYQRAMEVQGYVKSGYVYLNPHASYYSELMSELTQFSEDERGRVKKGIHDDQVDALVDGIYYLLYNKIGPYREPAEEKKEPVYQGMVPNDYARQLTGRGSRFRSVGRD